MNRHLAFTLLVLTAVLSAAPIAHGASPDACSILTPDHAQRLLGTAVEKKQRQPEIPSTTSSSCAYITKGAPAGSPAISVTMEHNVDPDAVKRIVEASGKQFAIKPVTIKTAKGTEVQGYWNATMAQLIVVGGKTKFVINAGTPNPRKNDGGLAQAVAAEMLSKIEKQ